jgi:GINS complex subunit 2
MTSFSSSISPHRVAALKTFLASDDPITIIPAFTYESKLSDFLLTQRNIGPFIAGEATVVPLWLGKYLRKRNLCRLVAPIWMNVIRLKRVAAFERNPKEDNFSQDLPFRYLEISRSIFECIGADRSAAHSSGGGGGNEEIPDLEAIRVLLEDIRTIRKDKIRRSIHQISADAMGSSMERPMPILDVTGIGATEIAEVKPFFEMSFSDHLNIVRSGTESNTQAVQSQQSKSNNSIRNTSIPSRRNTSQQSTNSHNESREEQHNDSDNSDSDNLIEPTANDSDSEQVGRRQVRRHR